MSRPVLSWLIAAVCAASCGGDPAVEWTEGKADADGRAQHTLTLRNLPGGSRLWFQELHDDRQVTAPEGISFTHYQGTSVYVDLPEEMPGTLTICYKGRALPRHSWAPEGFILQQQGKENRPLPVEYHFLPLSPEAPAPQWVQTHSPVQPGDLIPRPKRLVRSGEAAPPASPAVHPEGWYRIRFQDGTPRIESEDRFGELYARQTLAKVGDPGNLVEIEDWPDFSYRGLMLDVVRDFRSTGEVLRILDIMACYKLNRLHFHLADDEAWCLEIASLPDLTAFSGWHALPDWDLRETRALKPTANGKTGNRTFYTREEYKQILSYAWERGIAVIPEFDTPGHSRSSIKAMQAYERRSGEDTYRLQDPADSSRYWSAQDFKDNVLDPELPGVYRFYGEVFDEVIRLHQEAGVPLLAIHIGGDEVPDGVWQGRDSRALKDLFTNRMLDLAQERGLLLAGWQELGLGIAPATKERLKKQVFFLNAWSTNARGELTYRLANEGFPVLLCNVDNTYIDLAYSADPREIGLHWGGYVDEYASFCLDPWHIAQLPLEQPDRILGAQANLWSENLRSFEDATYQMLPKALGVWERAWNGAPDWSTPARKEADFDAFYSIIKEIEMPIWEKEGFYYKKR